MRIARHGRFVQLRPELRRAAHFALLLLRVLTYVSVLRGI